MAKWLVPSKSGLIYRNSAGRVYTGVAGVPVNFEDADAPGALLDGWSYASTQALPAQGALTPTIAAYSTDPLTGKISLISPTGSLIACPATVLQKSLRMAKQANASNLFINPIPASPVTVANTTVDPAFAVNYNLVSYVGASSALLKFYGGIEKNQGGNYCIVSASGGAAGAGSGSPKQTLTNAVAIEFMTAATSCAIKLFPNGGVQKYRVAVNGVYTSTPQTTATTGSTWVTVGIGAVPLPTGANRIRFEFEQTSANNQCLLNNLYVPTGYEVWAPSDDESVEALFIGDSYFSTGVSGQYEHLGLPAIVSQKLGWNYTASGIGGTGYVAAGGNSAYGSAGRLADYAIKSFDQVVIFGSVNDSVGAVNSANYLATKAAALALYQAVRTANPLATIRVFGVPVTVSLAVANAIQGEVALQDAFTAWGDLNAAFIPMSNISGGTGSWVSTTNAANYIAGDNTHLTQLGVYYTADRMVQSIRATF